MVQLMVASLWMIRYCLLSLNHIKDLFIIAIFVYTLIIMIPMKSIFIGLTEEPILQILSDRIRIYDNGLIMSP